MIRRFRMIRRTDETGVSGTGYVGDGVVFDGGLTIVRWRDGGIAQHATLRRAFEVHGHGGQTLFSFLDEPEAFLRAPSPRDVPFEPHVVERPEEPEKNAEAWLCCMCFSDMDLDVNHCFECGAGGPRIAMSKWQLDAVQTHDKQRLGELNKQQAELRALRRVLYDVFGPVPLGVLIEKYEHGEHKGRVSGVRRRGSGVVYCGEPRGGETEEEYLAREVERVEFDPEDVRRMHRDRQTVRQERSS